MTRETRAFLNLVRAAQDPTPADEARVLLALKATLAAGAATTGAAGLAQSRWAKAGSTIGAAGSKLGLVVVCTVAAFFATADSPRPRALDPEHSPVAGVTRQAPPEAPPALPPPTPTHDPAVAPGSPPRQDGSSPSSPPARAGSSQRPGGRAASPLRVELELIQRVQRALQRGDGQAALRALDAHQTTDRVLLEERQAARILALCKVGRVAEARRAAADFAEAHPNSVQREAIATSCANFR